MTRSAGSPPIIGRAELRPEFRAEQIVAMPAVHRHRWTTAEVNHLVDQREGLSPRFELVDGALLVTPSPSGRHQRIVLHLALVLQPFLSRHRLGELRLGPGELTLASGQRFEPDLCVVPANEGRRPAAGDSRIRPLLICEVLSPGSSRHDRITKRRAFQDYGVADYWVVDGDAEAFEIWHPSDERAALIDDRVTWTPSGASDLFDLDVKSFFAALADDAPI